ncbi:MAG: DUF4197 domain-containing protein [Pseudopedobacter saltans]|uniref:DUF4197 domain-containing protein n=1 Tax=Pseudopedobacter saltans TaxID=151895 RepID=A0A2W5F7K1_9SPHI|nr:MAG: DUF4197 domain-containing protein [Pseudopedobacter saltans]
MKKLFLPLTAFVLLTSTMSSCDSVNHLSNIPGLNGGITQNEAQQGIQQVLLNGILDGVLNLNKKDGFFGNAAYKLLLPEDAQKVVGTLKSIGLGSVVDQAVLQINRSAEDAVGLAKPIFTNAVKQMTVTDALQLVKGGNNSITNYFKSKTTDQLIAAFKPVIASSLNKTDATKYYGDIVKTYNSIPLTKNKINPDLTDYVAKNASNALFDQIAKEEVNIRQNPVARTTDILKKVFGQQSK